ncbi:MAG: sugar ABC transporter permease [Lachnospiraceae bacterium]|nr:sugar ABC transporter permease [Lachnospiraceae bacterium]
MTFAEKRKKTLRLMKRNWLLYVFLLPAVLFIVLFKYGPMYGLQIAFQNYSITKGFSGSEWVGLKWFIKFFESPRFWVLLKNTLTLSLYSLVVGFPIPIILALVLNNVKGVKRKKFAQTITYMPHFISTVVLVGMISAFFSPSSGFVNTLLSYLGGSGDTYFMGDPSYFSHMYVWSGVWQEAGWGSIIYMAALAGVDPTLHEAAMIDGANKFKRIIHIDLPTIIPTIIIMLIMRCGSILGVGYEKVFLMQNDMNIAVSEVISTYVYKLGLINRQYSYSTAVGLFNNAINFTLLVIVNKAAKKISGSSLW